MHGSSVNLKSQRKLMVASFTVSGYPRVDGDNYQTVDPRCLDSLLEVYDFEGPILDPCVSPEGESQLVTQLIDHGYKAIGGSLYDHNCNSVITNPPYKRDVVDKIASEILYQVQSGQLQWAALLVRSGWDQAKKRQYLFDDPAFSGLVRLTFRPWWTESRKAQPIHGYQWVVLEHDKYKDYQHDGYEYAAEVFHVYL